MSIGTCTYIVHTRKYPVITHFSVVDGWQMTFTLMRERKNFAQFLHVKYVWYFLWHVACGAYFMSVRYGIDNMQVDK